MQVTYSTTPHYVHIEHTAHIVQIAICTLFHRFFFFIFYRKATNFSCKLHGLSFSVGFLSLTLSLIFGAVLIEPATMVCSFICVVHF